MNTGYLLLLLISTYLCATWLPYAVLRVTNHIEHTREYRKFISRSWQIGILPFHLLIFCILSKQSLTILPETIRFIAIYALIQGCIYSLTSLWNKMQIDRATIKFGDKSLSLDLDRKYLTKKSRK